MNTQSSCYSSNELVNENGKQLHEPSTLTWELISQGAEARIWYIPSFLGVTCLKNGSDENHCNASKSVSLAAICKERFPKKYRHTTLDSSILKSRTKGEMRCLVRCRRGGVPCPAILACDLLGQSQSMSENDKKTNSNNNGRSSMRLFLEFIPGVTLREFFDRVMVSQNDTSEASNSQNKQPWSDGTSPPPKRSKIQGEINDASKTGCDILKFINGNEDMVLMKVAYSVGEIIAKMHNVNVVHGDLTTSNIMMKNESYSSTPINDANILKSWKPKLVLIDFGLAGTAGAKGINHEEKAVDLYVLERAIESTHPTFSESILKEIFRAYKKISQTSDSVMQRLSQVRLRGRKRECFG